MGKRDSQRTHKLRRCTRADQSAGIGREVGYGDPTDFKNEGLLAALAYANEAVTLCPEYSIVSDTHKLLYSMAVQSALSSAIKYKETYPRSSPASEAVQTTLAWTKSAGEKAAQSDRANISGFCTELDDVFGEKGRLFPNLVSSKRA